MNSAARAAWVALMFLLVMFTGGCRWFDDDCETTTDPGEFLIRNIFKIFSKLIDLLFLVLKIV